jgi:F-type H+-transporting ATPase subunit delta
VIRSQARPYAAALSMLIKTKASQKKWFDGLDEFMSILAVPVVQVMIRDPRVTDQQRLNVFKSAIKNDGFKPFWALIKVLIENKRLYAVSEIKVILKELLSKSLNTAYAEIKIPGRPTKAIEESIRSWIIKQYSVSNVEVQWNIQPNMVGGLVLEVNGQQLDGSLLGRLDKVKQSLGVE